VRFGAFVPTYGEWRFMPAVLGQLSKVVPGENIAILWGKKTFSGKPVNRWTYPGSMNVWENNIIEGDWASEVETRNAGLEIMRRHGIDYAFTLDSDEIYTEKDLWTIRNTAELLKPNAVTTRLYTYWKHPFFRVDPPEGISIPAITSVNAKYIGHRGFATSPHQLNDIFCHHLSYVRTDDELHNKLAGFSHATEIIETWLMEKWERWDMEPSIYNLHPTQPEAYRQIIFAPNVELDEILREWGCYDPV
jgi:hypothetical protein